MFYPHWSIALALTLLYSDFVLRRTALLLSCGPPPATFGFPTWLPINQNNRRHAAWMKHNQIQTDLPAKN
jgi:hypothetical protein